MADLPECIYRRFTRRPGLLRLHCFLKRSDCTQEECLECTYARKQQGKPCLIETITPVEKDGIVIKDTGIGVVNGFLSESIDPNLAAFHTSKDLWIVDHSDDLKFTPRSDLQAIRQTLPKHKPGRDRHFTIEPDGSIVYAQEEGDWEPPRDIRGYKRDPENEWRFIPLWLRCLLRSPRGKRTGSCGCIQITMTCINFDSELNRKEVSHGQCQQCPVRAERKGE